jgi:hypothetical protein
MNIKSQTSETVQRTFKILKSNTLAGIRTRNSKCGDADYYTTPPEGSFLKLP